MFDSLDLDAIRAAADRIAPHVVRTPMLQVRHGDADLLLKPEGLQPTGAFKLRGAFSLMTTLSDDTPGVRAARADELAASEGLVPVPPYDHPLIAAGQGTAALELLDDAGSLDRFYAPVSGGGLMAGCATVLHARCPDAEIVGVEPADGDDTLRSLAAGERVSVPPPRSLADGLRVRRPGALTFEVVRRRVQRIELVTDDELLDAMAWALDTLRLVLEPSGAASLAVALREEHGRCGVLLSGGNVSPELLAEVSQREPPRSGPDSGTS